MQTHPLVMKELTILNSFCLHVTPSVQEGEQHPVRESKGGGEERGGERGERRF